MLKKSLLPLLAASIALTASSSHASSLTDSQRKELNKRLLKIIDKSEQTLESRQATAYSAYKNALSSNNAAFDLYIKCVEKVNFEDAGRKASDFRDWKRKNKEAHSDAGFRLALRHQLNWLVLTIDASRIDGDDYSSLTSRALSAVNSIFEDGEALERHNGILRQNVLGSIFARAYGFGNFEVKNWSPQPLNITNLFEKVILPSLRENKESDALRSAWMQRISYEEKLVEMWGKKPESKSVGIKKDSPAVMKFNMDTRPRLIWQMEMDVFKSGDELGAATRMLSHISKNHGHNDAVKWAEELNTLIAPEVIQESDGNKATGNNILTSDEINNYDNSEDDE